MTESVDAETEALTRAATLQFALLRFANGAAHASRASTAPGQPRIGEDAFVFTPSWRPVRNEDVVAFLVGLPSPALLMPTTTRGIVALTLIGELSGDRAAWGQKTLSNQRAGLDEVVAQLDLGPDARFVVEFEDEIHVVDLRVMRVWAERFCAPVAWNITPTEGDARAEARLNFFRSDGERSWGGSCPLRLPN